MSDRYNCSTRIALTARAVDFPGTLATRRLGGVTIYAAADAELSYGLAAIAEAICICSRSHVSLTRNTLKSQVVRRIGAVVDKRVFGAIVGEQLRLGRLDSILCASAAGKPFRVLIHADQVPRFTEYVRVIAQQIRVARVLEVTNVERELFVERQWGTWSSASHILARLVFMGHACYLNRSIFAWPSGLENAVRNIK